MTGLITANIRYDKNGKREKKFLMGVRYFFKWRGGKNSPLCRARDRTPITSKT